MKGKFLAILLSLVFLFSGCAPVSVQEKTGLSVVASFYPIWVLAANVVEGLEDVQLTLLTSQDAGCLHNYQLLPRDMKVLDGADILVLNGAGMEGFIEDAAKSFTQLTLVDTAENLHLIENGEHAHEHDHNHGHDHSVNSHVWLDVDNAIAQTQVIAESLKAALPQQTEQIERNAAAYIDRLKVLKAEMESILEPVRGKKIVTSHDSFAYFAHEFDLHVEAVIQPDEETDPSAAHLGEICDLMESENIPAVFVQPDTTGSAPQVIAREVGAKLVTLDPLTGGELDAAGYERAQLNNARAIAEVLQ